MTNKPKRKLKWYWKVVYFLILFWFIGGVEIFLLRDISGLLFALLLLTLILLPIPKLLGKPDSKLYGFLWGITGLAIVFSVIAAVPPFTISRQTTYLLEHSERYPATLNELCPDYFTELTIDPFSQKQYIYRTENNGYLLYSIGRNHIDDNGHTNNDVPKGDDIIRRVPR